MNILLRGKMAVAVCFTACAATQVPVRGPAADVSALTGDWHGAYSSVETGRHGDIHFTLESGADTARGYVVMVPHTDHRAMPAINEPYQSMHDERFQAQGLQIQFVHVAGGEVYGELAPYRSPDCGCQLRTVFRGRLVDGTIEGTFRSEHSADGRVDTGEWIVRRETGR